MGPISYIPIYPSPHYRPHTTAYNGSISPVQPTSAFPPNEQSNESTHSSSSQASTPAHPSRNSSSQPPSSATSAPMSGLSGINCKLEPPGKEITADEIVAAVQAALRHAASQVTRCEEDEQHCQNDSLDMDPGGVDMAESDSIGVAEDSLIGAHGYGSLLERPVPMEHMLTEDGEPMLNPGQLLDF